MNGIVSEPASSALQNWNRQGVCGKSLRPAKRIEPTRGVVREFPLKSTPKVRPPCWGVPLFFGVANTNIRNLGKSET